MPSCAGLVGRLGIVGGQDLALYPQSTTKVFASQKLMRRATIDTHSLILAFKQALCLFSSIKFSYARYAQALCIQINKESY